MGFAYVVKNQHEGHFVMKSLIILSLLLSLLSACSDGGPQYSIGQFRRDHTDSVVSKLKEQIKRGELSKYELSHKSKFGGGVYELFNRDESSGYLHSSVSGEAGSTELKCYFEDGQAVFAVHRDYVFESRGSEYLLDKPRLVFEQVSYIEGDKIVKKTITKNEKNELRSSENRTTDEQLIEKINDIRRELAEERIINKKTK